MEGFGRRLRRNLAQVRRHIDSVASILNYIENRTWQVDGSPDRVASHAHLFYSFDSYPACYSTEKPIDCVTTKFVRAAMNKVKCPIYDICWTPEGRRLITGASSGEFTLWNGTAFNFETILQAHDSAVRAMKWSHNDLWMVTADHDGFVKYWQANMNNVTMFQAHKEAVRSLSFCPNDSKFATASDDGTVRVWDFIRIHEERILRGHGSDVRSVDWHPQKGLLVSGSRDSQQPVKLWDPKTGQCIATLHEHKNAVMAVQWNQNGNWMISGSRDHLIKLYDIRMMKEVTTFKGHKKEVTALAWHPCHEGLFVSGGADGAMMFWMVTNDKEVGLMETAHEQALWTLKWHPLGHILASGSNDNNTKFWTRNKPGDTLEDFYSIVTNVYEQHTEPQRVVPQAPAVAIQQEAINDVSDSNIRLDSGGESVAKVGGGENESPAFSIPGMGLESDMLDKIREGLNGSTATAATTETIPGIGLPPVVEGSEQSTTSRKTLLKQPPPKKAQRQFERMWNVSSAMPNEGSIVMDMDYRKSKPSLLGPAPDSSQADMGPSLIGMPEEIVKIPTASAATSPLVSSKPLPPSGSAVPHDTRSPLIASAPSSCPLNPRPRTQSQPLLPNPSMPNLLSASKPVAVNTQTSGRTAQAPPQQSASPATPDQMAVPFPFPNAHKPPIIAPGSVPGSAPSQINDFHHVTNNFPDVNASNRALNDKFSTDFGDVDLRTNIWAHMMPAKDDTQPYVTATESLTNLSSKPRDPRLQRSSASASRQTLLPDLRPPGQHSDWFPGLDNVGGTVESRLADAVPESNSVASYGSPSRRDPRMAPRLKQDFEMDRDFERPDMFAD
ncbi:unnamed protein product, partial [Soboliphyme baturini]|uniref:pre-mRNA 3' end processing protein WDR33 n=1 Tax=Soboliphyme baturini TaxID=241478 RepID=A0A183IPX3_9BILA